MTTQKVEYVGMHMQKPDWFNEYDERNAKEHAALMAITEAQRNQLATVLTNQDTILERLEDIQSRLP